MCYSKQCTVISMIQAMVTLALTHTQTHTHTHTDHTDKSNVKEPDAHLV